jgi:hypothetical protein
LSCRLRPFRCRGSFAAVSRSSSESSARASSRAGQGIAADLADRRAAGPASATLARLGPHVLNHTGDAPS